MSRPAPPASVGRLLRHWREHRRLSQLELSSRAEVSTRHLSWLETGRSRPTAAMILRLAEQLDVPLRERNDLLLAGGFAPAYGERGLDSPELAAVLASLRQLLDATRWPALVLDRLWDVVDANDAATALIAGAAPALREPPVNVLRLSLHPEGLAPAILNLGEWRSHVLEQLRCRAERTADPRLRALYDEVSSYPGGREPPPAGAVVVPLRIAVAGQEVALFSLATSVQTAADVTVDELTVETLHPVDNASAAVLASLLQARQSRGSGSRSPSGR